MKFMLLRQSFPFKRLGLSYLLIVIIKKKNLSGTDVYHGDRDLNLKKIRLLFLMELQNFKYMII